MALDNGHNAVLIDDFAGLLVREVLAAVGDALVDVGHGLLALLPGRRERLLFGQAALHPRQCLLVPAEEAGVGDLLACGQGGKGGQAHVKADLFRAHRQRHILNLARERHRPLPRRGAPHATRLHSALQGPMQHDAYEADARQMHMRGVRQPVAALAPCLRVAERVIPALTTEAREAGCLPRPHAPEECLVRQVQAHGHVLQDLTMHRLQGRTLGLQGRQPCVLVVEAHAALRDLIRHPPLFQQTVIQPAAFV